MSRGNDAIKQYGLTSKEAEFALKDCIAIAKHHLADKGAGTLFISLPADSRTYFTIADIEADLEDEDLSEEEKTDLQGLLNKVRGCDFTKQVCITVLSEVLTSSTQYFSAD